MTADLRCSGGGGKGKQLRRTASVAVVPGLERLRGGARRPRREAEQEAGYTSSNSGTD